MAENSAISWTRHTWNPWMGCTKISPACDGCYAEALMDKRYGKVQWGNAPRVRTGAHTWNDPFRRIEGLVNFAAASVSADSTAGCDVSGAALLLLSRASAARGEGERETGVAVVSSASGYCL